MSDRYRPSDMLHGKFLDKKEEILLNDEKPALCYVGTKGLYLKANGVIYPCCWVANRYDHNREIIEVAESRFNLNKRTVQEILADEWWSDDARFDNLECRTKCTHANFTDEFVTEW
jgi:hypothetical protein